MKTVKVYSVVFMGDFTSSDPRIFGFITRITTDSLVGSVVEFRPLSEDEFLIVKESAIKNRAKLIYSSYDESMKDSVEMHLLDGNREFAARRRAAKGK